MKRGEFVVSFKLKNNDKNRSTTFYLPVYIQMTTNHVELYSYNLDFGILYSNSQMIYKLPIRMKSISKTTLDVGYPFVPYNSPLDFNFTKLISNEGNLDLANSIVVGTVSLKTQGLQVGEYSGKIVLCTDKICKNDVGKTRLYYTFVIAKDPLNSKLKMHSFEIDTKHGQRDSPTSPIQSLWLKNTFSHPVRIEDVTCHDEEMSIQVLASKNLKDTKSDQQ